ncbi:nucleoside hydrolase [Bifidobacterium longum]
MRKKLILDLDTGIDDALAIAYALGSADEIDLIGITATYGNVAVPLAARNALAVLHLFGRDDVPVYPGVDHPIAPATLPTMRGTTPDERAKPMRAGRTAARAAGKRTLRGHQLPARWRSTIPTASAAQSSPTPRALRKHQAWRSISSSPPRTNTARI